MKYRREQIVSNIYETSKSQKAAAMFPASAKQYAVYDLDKVKDEFCLEYRHGEKIKSCDAYYYDNHNQMVIEYKNTHHYNLKAYYDEIEIKILDTHMLLKETFCKTKKHEQLCKNLCLIVVYNDALNYGEGICGIQHALNTIKPIKGNTSRAAKQTERFVDDAEYWQAVDGTKSKYEGCFYKEIQFMEKTDFWFQYLDSGYFKNLAEWPEMI